MALMRFLRASSPQPAYRVPVLPKPASGSCSGDRQNFRGRNLGFHRPAEKLQQHLNSLPRRQEAGNDYFEALEGPLGDSDGLSNLDLRIEGHDLLFASFFLQGRHGLRIERGHVIAEMDDASDSVRMLNPPMQKRQEQLRKQIPRKHCLDEPNSSSASGFRKSYARCETPYFQAVT